MGDKHETWSLSIIGQGLLPPFTTITFELFQSTQYLHCVVVAGVGFMWQQLNCFMAEMGNQHATQVPHL